MYLKCLPSLIVDAGLHLRTKEICILTSVAGFLRILSATCVTRAVCSLMVLTLTLPASYVPTR
jgi:hypothetical protein